MLANSKTEFDSIKWSMITIPKPLQYTNLSLYFSSHLDSDFVTKCVRKPEADEHNITDTEELAEQF